jgi:hypothetical protein
MNIHMEKETITGKVPEGAVANAVAAMGFGTILSVTTDCGVITNPDGGIIVDTTNASEATKEQIRARLLKAGYLVE